MIGGIVINNEFGKDGTHYTIVTYDYENESLKVITPKGGSSYGDCMLLDVVSYFESNDSITRISDSEILMISDDLVLIYKEYLKIARDMKIDYITKNNIIMEYKNDLEAKKIFKEQAQGNIISNLEGIEIILKTVINRLKEYIDERNLYYLFFKNNKEGEKKHGYSK